MKDIGTIKIHCISEVLSPLTHMMGIAGNEAIINREKILYKEQIRDIPVISGNSLRHKIIRRPGAFYLIENLNLKGKLNADQANFLFTGGSLTESTTTEDMRKISNMQSFFPLFRLLGGSLRNQIIAGSLVTLRGILICEENRSILKSSLPENFNVFEKTLKSSEDFISKYQYTRGDAQKHCENLEEKQEKSNLMIYNGQAVLPGALFYHGFILDKISKLEVGALFNSISIWQENGGFLGGMSRVGHGKIKMSIIIDSEPGFYDNEIDINEEIENYKNHVNNNIDNCIEWLNNCFK